MGYWHAFTAKRLGAQIVGIFDRDRGRAERLARSYRGAEPCLSVERLLSDRRPDAVHVCTPSADHAEQVAHLVEASIHTFVEKPFQLSAVDTREIIARAQTAGVIVCPVHQMPFQRGVARAVRALARLGPLRHIGLTICSAGGAGRGGIELDAIVGDILPHPLSLLAHIWPSEVLRPEHWTVFHPASGELLLAGVHARVPFTCRISMHARPTRMELVLVGTNGSAYLDLFHGFAWFERGAATRRSKLARPFASGMHLFGAAAANLALRCFDREPAYPGLRCLTRHFYAAVAGREPCPIGPDTVIDIAEARDRLLERLCLGSSTPPVRALGLANGG